MSGATMLFTGISIFFFFIDAGCGLSCRRCEEVSCNVPTNCPGGIVLGACRCCQECAKQLNESCTFGTCDDGLECVTEFIPGGIGVSIRVMCKRIADTELATTGAYNQTATLDQNTTSSAGIADTELATTGTYNQTATLDQNTTSSADTRTSAPTLQWLALLAIPVLITIISTTIYFWKRCQEQGAKNSADSPEMAEMAEHDVDIEAQENENAQAQENGVSVNEASTLNNIVADKETRKGGNTFYNCSFSPAVHQVAIGGDTSMYDTKKIAGDVSTVTNVPAGQLATGNANITNQDAGNDFVVGSQENTDRSVIAGKAIYGQSTSSTVGESITVSRSGT